MMMALDRGDSTRRGYPSSSRGERPEHGLPASVIRCGHRSLEESGEFDQRRSHGATPRADGDELATTPYPPRFRSRRSKRAGAPVRIASSRDKAQPCALEESGELDQLLLIASGG